MCLELKEGAVFIADAHYPNHKREEFLDFLNSIYLGKIYATQLILMGDIFDLLVGNSSYLKNRFKDEIALLENIASKIEVIYLEGNHDFYLKPIFNRVKIFPIDKQPLYMKYSNLVVALSHGDNILMPLKYKIYTRLIRNPLILKILPDLIAKYKLKSMSKKRICKDIPNFENRVKDIKKYYKADIIIEGHYHQDKIYDNYYALPSFACSLKYARAKDKKIEYEIFTS